MNKEFVIVVKKKTLLFHVCVFILSLCLMFAFSEVIDRYCQKAWSVGMRLDNNMTREVLTSSLLEMPGVSLKDPSFFVRESGAVSDHKSSIYLHWPFHLPGTFLRISFLEDKIASIAWCSYEKLYWYELPGDPIRSLKQWVPREYHFFIFDFLVLYFFAGTIGALVKIFKDIIWRPVVLWPYLMFLGYFFCFFFLFPYSYICNFL